LIRRSVISDHITFLSMKRDKSKSLTYSHGLIKRLILIRLPLKNSWLIYHLKKWDWFLKEIIRILLIKYYHSLFQLDWHYYNLDCCSMLSNCTQLNIILLIGTNWTKGWTNGKIYNSKQIIIHMIVTVHYWNQLS
jgi:hypothetical protein